MITEQIMLAFGMPGPAELIVIGLVAVLLFGNRLPDVGRSLGKGIIEFKKGIKGINEEIDEAASKSEKTDN
ncbi:MAG: twin-arginine translocase TatA/TatE family subunit [Sedimentisphaerales bacterium]|nr:twin-arginine translocase TatA/TatE family subunit [Sedimentisphaerales bacterium]